MEQEYSTVLGVNFVQTVDAPLNHVVINPLVFLGLIQELSRHYKDNETIDIYIHKGVIPELTFEEKVNELTDKITAV